MKYLPAALLCLFLGLGHTQSALSQTTPIDSTDADAVETDASDSVENDSTETDAAEIDAAEIDAVEAEPENVETPVTPSALLPGFYYGRGSVYINSWRRVEREGDRFCVEIAGGPPSPYAGLIIATVSSLSLRENQLYVDSSDFPMIHRPSRLEPDDKHFEFGPPYLRTEWIFQPPSAERPPTPLSEQLTACLAASETYVGYDCRWTNGRGVLLGGPMLTLPLTEELQALAENSCEQGASAASSQ